MSSDQSYHPDPEKLSDLANEWYSQAIRLDTFKTQLVDAVTGIDWTGSGRDAAVDAAHDLAAQAQDVIDKINAWADRLADESNKLQDQLNAEHLFEILFGPFFVVGLAAAFVLTPIAVVPLAEVLAGALTALEVGVELASTVGTFAAGFTVFGALSAALDFAQLGIVDAATSQPFKPTWVDGVMIGTGALAGGFLPGMADPVIAKLGGKVPDPIPPVETLNGPPGSAPSVQVSTHGGSASALPVPRPQEEPAAGDTVSSPSLAISFADGHESTALTPRPVTEAPVQPIRSPTAGRPAGVSGGTSITGAPRVPSAGTVHPPEVAPSTGVTGGGRIPPAGTHAAYPRAGRRGGRYAGSRWVGVAATADAPLRGLRAVGGELDAGLPGEHPRGCQLGQLGQCRRTAAGQITGIAGHATVGRPSGDTAQRAAPYGCTEQSSGTTTHAGQAG